MPSNYGLYAREIETLLFYSLNPKEMNLPPLPPDEPVSSLIEKLKAEHPEYFVTVKEFLSQPYPQQIAALFGATAVGTNNLNPKS